MKFRTQPYRTPEGKIDFPFLYIFDSSGIADGLAQLQNLVVQLQGGDEIFVLRSILGVPLVVDTPANGGRFSYRNASGNYANGNPSSGIVVGNVWPVLPEKLYPGNGGGIFFDLYQTLRNFTVCGGTPIYNSQIAFLGVKRLPASSGFNTGKTSYKFRPVAQTYEFDLTVNWNHFAGASVAPPRRFQVLMDRYDFELQKISIAKTTTGSQGTGTLTTNDFQIMPYDANLHQMASSPVNQFFINSGRPTPATAPTYQPALAPTVVYPFGSAITFDITSMLCNAVASPQTYNIAFQGIWRLPC